MVHSNCNSVLLITLTCSPEGWIAKGAAQTGSVECIWKAPQAAPKQSCMWSRSTAPRPDVFDWESIFGEGRKPEYPEKNSQVRLRSAETQATYDRRTGRCKCRIQRQPDFVTCINWNWACIWLCAGHKWLRIVTCHQMLKHSEEKRPKNTVQKRTTAFRLNLL